MTDADGLLAARFGATRDHRDDSDWADVLERAKTRGAGRRPWRLALVAVILLLTVAVPTLALSASVRGLLGLDNPHSPDYRHARLAVSAALPDGRVAHVWVAPSKNATGECEFVTVDPAGRTLRPTAMSGGGFCRIGRQRLRGRLAWSFSHGGRDIPIIHGHVNLKPRPARVVLRWHGGSQRLAYRAGFFVAGASSLIEPPFRRLPYDVVAYEADGRVAAVSRIPTSFLYDDWKRVQPRLHRYRVTHGCETTVVWRCKSR